jgi:hypothetical protein
MTKNWDGTTFQNGDSIPEVTDAIEWSNLTTPAWCYYDNDPANGDIYGKLYNWYAVSDPRGLAPLGWRIPTDADFNELFTYVGNPEGGNIKEVGFIYWDSPNTGATNSSGFSALGAGRRAELGSFTDLKQQTFLGISDVVGGFYAAGYNYDIFPFGTYPEQSSVSIRLIKDI